MKVFRSVAAVSAMFALAMGGPGFWAAEESAHEEGAAQPIKFVAVPEGTFTLGSPADAYPTFELPPTPVKVSALEMTQTEITNGQYAEFCKATERDLPPVPEWAGSESEEFFARHANYPVVRVSWRDAEAFAQWLSEKEAAKVRLPTEAEWERAARYSTGNETPTFAWGEHYPHHHGIPGHDIGNAIGEEDHFLQAAPVAYYPDGATRISGEKIFDLVGNVSEWCLDSFDYHPFPTDGQTLDNPVAPDKGFRRVIKGSSYEDDVFLSRPAFRRGLVPTAQVSTVGFRVVKVKE